MKSRIFSGHVQGAVRFYGAEISHFNGAPHTWAENIYFGHKTQNTDETVTRL